MRATSHPCPRANPSAALRRRRPRPEHAVDAGPTDPEPPGDGRGTELLLLAQPPHLGRVDDGLAALVDALRLRRPIPSSCRSRRRLVSNSANTPSMSRNALPAAVPVSTGCSVARRATPFCLQLVDDVLQVLQRAREPIDARDHQRVAAAARIRAAACSSVRPSRRVPLAFSARTTPQPAALRAARWRAEVLVEGAHARVAVEGHAEGRSVSLGL